MDIVFYQDSSYVAKQDVIGQTPTNTTYWDELAVGGGGSSEWGSITGNISDQTDLQTALGEKENTTNKVTSLSSSSTDTQYPSAKCVYDLIGDISSAIDAINGEVV